MLLFRKLQHRWKGFVCPLLEEMETSFQLTCARHGQENNLSIAFHHQFKGDISCLHRFTAFLPGKGLFFWPHAFFWKTFNPAKHFTYMYRFNVFELSDCQGQAHI